VGSSSSLLMLFSTNYQEIDLEGAFKLFTTAKLNDVKPHNSSLCNLLSLVAGLGDQGSGNDYFENKHSALSLI